MQRESIVKLYDNDHNETLLYDATEVDRRCLQGESVGSIYHSERNKTLSVSTREVNRLCIPRESKARFSTLVWRNGNRHTSYTT